MSAVYSNKHAEFKVVDIYQEAGSAGKSSRARKNSAYSRQETYYEFTVTICCIDVIHSGTICTLYTSWQFDWAIPVIFDTGC
jgi:hypothetical protein